jgi:Holliday junction resolvase RusA-like endonuclease
MSEVLFKCKILVPKHGIKKNNKQLFKNKKTGKMFIASSNSAKQAENILTDKLNIQRLKNRLDTITCEINAQYVFYFPNSVYFTKKGEKSKRLPDLSNLFETVSDALQKAKVIENDILIESFNGSHREPINDNNHWLEIVLTSKPSVQS